MTVLFVGERRSKTAKRRDWRWEDGHLAAKQLFDALEACGFDPKTQAKFVNVHDRGGKKLILKWEGSNPIIVMGKAAQRQMEKWDTLYWVPMVHPAARGKVRGKKEYVKEVRRALNKARHLFSVPLVRHL